MQEIEKSKILTKLEKLNLQIKENTISHIGIHISKYNELLAESTFLKDFYINRIVKYNTLVQKEEVKTLLTKLFCYIKTFSGIKICKNFIPEVNKIAVDGS